MVGTAQFEIGSQVHCSDGSCGNLKRLVIDPVAGAATHLVVEPTHRVGMARLVPIELTDGAAGGLRLQCTLAEFDRLETAEEARFLPGPDGDWGYEDGQVLSWPYYGLGVGDVGGGLDGFGGNAVSPVFYDKVPVGEVEVCRGDRVHASDGNIGRVQGLVLDPTDHRVTHVLLQEGHLWGRKEVAIPIGDVESVADGIHLRLTQHEVRDLPPVNLLPTPRDG
jgi:sporulation protein YlmC with PRC-barrel domain